MPAALDGPAHASARGRAGTALAAALALCGGSLAVIAPRASLAAPSDRIAVASPVNLALLEGPGVADADENLYLEVWLNGVHTRRVMHFALRGGRVLAWPENLRDIGLRLDGLPQDRYLDLAGLPDLEHRYDARNQRMHFDAPGRLLDLPTQRLATVAMPYWPASSTPGALLNYELFATHGDGDGDLSAATGLRLFGGPGVLESTGLSRFANGDGSRAYLRLDTAWTYAAQESLWTLTAGDFVSRGPSWTRPTRMGGLQLRRDFGLQPQLVTYPLPEFFGEAALPSSIELYVNGVRQYRGEVQPGPFRIDAAPGVSGLGQAQIVITDALGRSRMLDFGFYNSSGLLKPGLSDYALQLGAVRRDYGYDSFAYGDAPAAVASLRRGIADWITLEAHAEAADDLALGGGGAVLRLGAFGELAGACALSTSNGTRGSLCSGDYGWTGHGVTVRYGLSRASAGFRDVAALDGRPPPLRSERALLGYSLARAGSIGLHYTRLDVHGEARYRSAGLNYSASLHRNVSLFLGASRDLDDRRDYQLFAGLSLTPGARLSAGVSTDRRRGEDRHGAYVSRPLLPDGGSGWHLRMQRGAGFESYQADVAHRAGWGEIGAGAWALDGTERLYGSLAGSLVLMRSDLFAARRIDEGFALVSTGGVADVPVLLENRPIGRTDARGHYLLTGLNAWQPNTVSIEPLQLPPQIQVDRTSLTAVPADRSGVALDFALREVRAALLVLEDEAGKPVPLGSRARLDGSAAPPAVVGYDGQVYLEHLARTNRLRVTTPDGATCTLTFGATPERETIPMLGPLICERAP